MRASSNTSPGDKVRRPTRTAPRRHTSPHERPVSATYDSHEFPVLLRMPELPVETEASEEEVATAETRLDLQPPATHSTVPPTHRRSRSRHKDKELSREKPAPEKASTTAFASRLFWGTLAPKIAVGGMLLSVTALCVVVLQGPSQESLNEPSETKWAVEDSQSPTAASATSTPRGSHAAASQPTVQSTSASRHTVAAKPEPVRAPSHSTTSAATDIGPIEPIPAMPSDMTNQWSSQPSAGTSPASAPAAAEPFQAQGWPDDIETESAASVREPQLELNAATRSAQRQLLRNLPSTTPAANEAVRGTRLNGTVEIPKPSEVDYRL